MRSCHRNSGWIKKVLADLERHRGDPQIDAFMVEASSEPVPGLQPAPEPFGRSPSRLGRCPRR